LTFRPLKQIRPQWGITDGLDPNVFATAPEMISVSFDASPYLERKFFALAAHRSAFGVTPEMLKNPPPAAAQMLQAFRPVLEREVFLLGGAVPFDDGRCRISSTGWKRRNSIRWWIRAPRPRSLSLRMTIHHDHGDVIGEVGAGPLTRAIDQRRQEPIRGLRQANRQHIAKLPVAEELTVVSRRLCDAVRVEHERSPAARSRTVALQPTLIAASCGRRTGGRHHAASHHRTLTCVWSMYMCCSAGGGVSTVGANWNS
jgi:hypothetical protein